MFCRVFRASSLTFKDIVLLVKNAYFCVAKAKIHTPDSNFYLILNGTDQFESTFGVVWTMVGSDANVDVLMLSYCLSHTVECFNILSEHPEWDHGPRNLHLCRIEDGNRDVHSKCDHITPKSWEGNVDVLNISLVTAWNLGCQMVVSEFPANNIEDVLLELENKGYDMEFPFGQVVENLKEFDSSDECNTTPVVPDAQLLSAEDVSTLISLLKLGEGECILYYVGSHAQTGEGKDPILQPRGSHVY